jgi:hypothetical protein
VDHPVHREGRPRVRRDRLGAAAGPGSSGRGRQGRAGVRHPAADVRSRRGACRDAGERRPAEGARNRRAGCPVVVAGPRPAPRTGSRYRFAPPADPGHRGASRVRRHPGRPRLATAALRHVACRHAGRSRNGLPDRRTGVRGSVVVRRRISGYGGRQRSRFTPPRSSCVASEFSGRAFPRRMTAPGGSNYMCGRLPRRTR